MHEGPTEDPVQSDTVARTIPTAPPTTPGPIGHDRNAVWPTALGVTCIVFGVIGILSGAWSLLTAAFLGTFAGVASAGQGAAVVEVQVNWQVPMMLGQGLMLLVAVLLLIGGIYVVQRRRIGRPIVQWWAIAKILTALLMSTLTVLMQQEQMEAVAQQAPNAAQLQVIGPIMAMVTGALMLIWFLLLPVFCLIWFARAPVRKDMHDWK